MLGSPVGAFCPRSLLTLAARRYLATPATPVHQVKAAGDISSVFPSLSGGEQPCLPPRFADLKRRLSQGHEDRLQDSWHRLLAELRQETEIIRAAGSSLVPEISFLDVKYHNVEKITAFRDKLRKRGVAIIRGVVTVEEAMGWKELLKRYIRSNPSTKGFPAGKPAVYELYWSPSQILARAHPNLLKAQQFLMSHWHAVNKSALISTSHPVTYADRLRIRPPGDAGFALGPHVDSGSCERWEENGYGSGAVYDEIFDGNWETYDPWESSCRLLVVSDLYNSAGGCSMFRMFQGWLSLSRTSAGEGTLMINPLLEKATAYFLLRPFFRPRKTGEAYGSIFLESNNWKLEEETTSILQGAVPSKCQELNTVLHPHLDLENTMVHIPLVRPGDYVAWHCDTIHAVDKIHAGQGDSSVMYIPSCPLTDANAEYLVRQRDAFSEGLPGPDFPSGVGEGQHVGRLSTDFVMQNIDKEAQQAMGIARFDKERRDLPAQDRQMLERANEILGFV
ncbi:MAG: hypothetical protein Q9217_006365 [Psora testacea]